MGRTIRVFRFRVFDGRHHLALRLSAFCAVNPPSWPVCDSELPPARLKAVNPAAVAGQSEHACVPFFASLAALRQRTDTCLRGGLRETGAGVFGGPTRIRTWNPRASAERLRDALKRIAREAERPARDGRAGATHQGWFRGAFLVGPPGFEPGTKGRKRALTRCLEWHRVLA
jgi:hypothetical protein